MYENIISGEQEQRQNLVLIPNLIMTELLST